MVSILVGTKARREHKFQWWSLKLISLLIISTVMIVVGGVVLPSLKTQGLWNFKVNLIAGSQKQSSSLEEFPSVLQLGHQEMKTPMMHIIPSLNDFFALSTDNNTDNNSTDDNPYASYFLAINASKVCLNF